jgi:hypothetical protein
MTTFFIDIGKKFEISEVARILLMGKVRREFDAED